jgi:hypothetical protein
MYLPLYSDYILIKKFIVKKKKKAGGVAQCVGPEFKPQCCQKKVSERIKYNNAYQ